jgi:hypothetical protein
MTIIVEYESRPKWVHGAVSAVPGMTLTSEELLFTPEGEVKLAFWVNGGDFAAFEQALDADETVDRWNLVTELSERRLYAAILAGRPEEFSMSVTTELDVQVLNITQDHRRILVRVRCPSAEAVSALRDAVMERYDHFEVRKLYEEAETGTGAGFGVTPPQREALVRALAAGYYDVPRATTLKELATELDISDQALSARLRRGTATLLEETLARE